MKKGLLLIATFFLLSSCQPTQDGKGYLITTDSLQHFLDSLRANGLLAHELHDISLNETNHLVHDFVNNNRLAPIANSVSMGGYIRKNKLQELLTAANGNTPGIIFYYCYVPHTTEPGSRDSVYLAFKGLNDYNPADLGTNYIYAGDVFYKAINNQVYSGPSGTSNDIHAYFQTGIPIADDQVHSVLTVPELTERIERFKGSIVDGGSPPAPFNQYAFGFVNKLSLQELLRKTEGPGLRYYFGYDPSENQNKIRLILTTINNAGTMLLIPNGGYVMSNNIERAWP